MPLIALLGRRLTDAEVTDVAASETDQARVKGSRSVSEIDLVVAITEVTDELPTVGDIGRVCDAVNALGFTVRRRAPQHFRG